MMCNKLILKTAELALANVEDGWALGGISSENKSLHFSEPGACFTAQGRELSLSRMQSCQLKAAAVHLCKIIWWWYWIFTCSTLGQRILFGVCGSRQQPYCLCQKKIKYWLYLQSHSFLVAIETATRAILYLADRPHIFWSWFFSSFFFFF